MGKGKVKLGFILDIVGLVLAILGVWAPFPGKLCLAFILISLPVAIAGLVISVTGCKALKTSGTDSKLGLVSLILGIIAVVICGLLFISCGLCGLCATAI